MRSGRFAGVVDGGHAWALRRAREAIHIALSSRDRRLPELAERLALQLPGAAGPLDGRLYRPADVPPDAPLLLFFHGGGFVVSDLDTHEALCIRLADAGKMRVLSASYRLAPENRFPAQLDDAVAVTRWVLGGEGQSLAGGRPIAVGGDSAGAYLAASAVARLHGDHPGRIAAQALVHPLLQLDEAVWAERFLNATRMVGWAAVRYINSQWLHPGDHAPSLLSLSRLAPIPTVIAAGGVLDPCGPDAAQLAELMRASGQETLWREYPTLIHGFGSLTPVSQTAREAVAEIGTLIGQLLVRDQA